ncbi:MAG: ATP-dependent Clp protease proteolytic subunit, partial [Planctomycetota bacterium]
LHQPWGGVTGQAADIKIQAEEILKAKKLLSEIFAKHTGQPVEKIAEETERDWYMSAQEAKDYGLIDDVLQEPEEKKKKKDRESSGQGDDKKDDGPKDETPSSDKS